MQKFEKTWKSDIVEHKGFRDLGNYVIELPDITDPETGERARVLGNKLADNGGIPKFGCTAMVKKNSKGEVITGRNMDLDISQSPAYVFKTTCGKYKNVCVSYSPGFYLSYEEVQKLDDIDPNMKDQMVYSACDCLNEKGLYIEVNLRERNDKLTCWGLHSARGEEKRSDGTPWKDLRACTTGVCQHVSQNCATVKEALEFLKNSYDWYTIAPPPGMPMAVSHNNLCYMIADATGLYGVIEFAQDEINFLAYQYGHANYYITPKWNALDAWGAGLGRLDMVSKVITPVETLEEAMDAMKPIMWRNETLWIGESERRADKYHPNPYNQIIFQDDKGVPQMDWRGEYIHLWPVMDDGRMLISRELYDEAKKADYDPMIKKYYDDAIATGYLVIDDGSYKFHVNGKQVDLEELQARYNEHEAGAGGDLARLEELEPYYDEYWRILTNLTNRWVHNDNHYEAIKAAAYASLHTRRDADGKFDPSCMSQYEKLCAFYGKGVPKDEKPLRDDATIWTTSLNVGCNCMQKEIKIRFWENDEVIFHAKF